MKEETIMASDREERLILWFDEITIDDVPLVGARMHPLVRCTKDLPLKV